jgi:hypothetical protein
MSVPDYVMMVDAIIILLLVVFMFSKEFFEKIKKVK